MKKAVFLLLTSINTYFEVYHFGDHLPFPNTIKRKQIWKIKPIGCMYIFSNTVKNYKSIKIFISIYDTE
jgi:hypothetical protein